MDLKLHRPIIKWFLWIPGVLSISLLVFLAWVSSESTVKIVLGGDVMLARNWTPILSDENAFGGAMAVLRAADLSAANLESPIAYQQPSSSALKYDLCAPFTSGEILKKAGLDAVSIENNHTFDCSPTGDLETQKSLAEVGVEDLGGVESVRVFDLKGQKIAFLAYEDVSRPIDIDRMLSEVFEAHKTANVVIVSIHWGNEYQAGVSDRQIRIAQSLADAGVDVIWGHHPHVLQRAECLGSTYSEHKTLVLYSLGNLISDQYMLDDARRTALVTLSIRNGEITEMSVMPLVLDAASNRLRLATVYEQAWIFERLKWSTELPESCRSK